MQVNLDHKLVIPTDIITTNLSPGSSCSIFAEDTTKYYQDYYPVPPTAVGSCSWWYRLKYAEIAFQAEQQLVYQGVPCGG